MELVRSAKFVKEQSLKESAMSTIVTHRSDLAINKLGLGNPAKHYLQDCAVLAANNLIEVSEDLELEIIRLQDSNTSSTQGNCKG
jgi:hypothetical protein